MIRFAWRMRLTKKLNRMKNAMRGSATDSIFKLSCIPLPRYTFLLTREYNAPIVYDNNPYGQGIIRPALSCANRRKNISSVACICVKPALRSLLPSPNMS